MSTFTQGAVSRNRSKYQIKDISTMTLDLSAKCFTKQLPDDRLIRTLFRTPSQDNMTLFHGQ